MNSLVNLYGGPCDGMSGVAVAATVTAFIVAMTGLDESQVYCLSKPWSDYFGKRTAVPEGFPGLPPKRELQAA